MSLPVTKSLQTTEQGSNTSTIHHRPTEVSDRRIGDSMWQRVSFTFLVKFV